MENMFDEIVSKYEKFADAIVLKIEYLIVNHSRSVEVIVVCRNVLKDYEFETIKLTFNEIISFQFIEKENRCSSVIFAALLANNNETIVFDFFPLILTATDLQEDENSDFKIKCKQVNYINL